jgi:plasmid stabilization system protein ParE
MKVVFSREANGDLERIADYIAQDSPERAASFVNELVDAALRIADAPQGFALIPGYADYGLRRKPYGSYSLFYKVQADRIGIVRVLHSARDYEAILFPED